MRVEQAFIHVDVDNLRTIFDLVARDLDSGFIVAGKDQFFELCAASDIGAFTNINEARGRGAGRHFLFYFKRGGVRRP